MHSFLSFIKSIKCRLILHFIDRLVFHFKHPTTIQVSGPTRCIQTWLVRLILKKQLIQPCATRIIWMLSEWQPDYDMISERYPGIEFEKRWRDEIFDLLSHEQRNILVLDDQMSVSSWISSVADLFTKGSHHRNLTVIYLVQNVYNQGKSQITIFLNLHYSVVFRNGRDASQFRTMAYKICLNNSKWLIDSVTDATCKTYGYLVLNHYLSTLEHQSVVTNILPKEQPTYYQKSNA